LALTGGTLTGPLIGTTGNFSSGVTANAVTANQGTINIVQGTATNPALFMTDNTQNRSAFYFNVALGQTTINDIHSGASLTIDPSANFAFAGLGAYRGGPTTWDTTSDSRIKNVQGDYTAGLDEVLQLRPVTYTFKGNDTPTENLSKVGPDGSTTMQSGGAAPYSASAHYRQAEAQTPFVGLIAQEVETIFPDMVTLTDGYIDGAPVDDLRSLNTSELIFALVNAVKTLAARVEALEAAR